MIVASYVDYTSSHPATQWPATREQAPVAMTSVDYNRQAGAVAEYRHEPVAAEKPPPQPEAPRHGFLQPQLSINGRSQ